MSDQVNVGSGYVEVAGEKIPLISGEVHFWRIQRANWRAILETVYDMGLRTVATYVCWDFHRVAPGEYDFEGRTTPEHDLLGFLELTREMGFHVMMRPGPYIYSEWRNGGVIDEAAKVHRLSDTFFELSRPWIEAVAGVIAPFQITRGGHVIALQPDNEPYPAIPARGAEIGAYQEPGLFKEWIAARYDGKIDRLNAAWNASYADFNQCCLYYEEPYVDRTILENGRLCPEPQYEQRIVDSQDFVEWFAREIVARVGAVYRECGIDVPFFSNGWHPYAQNFHKVGDVAEIRGVDLYPPVNFEPIPADPIGKPWAYSMEILKVAADQAGWGYSAELEAGIWEGKHIGEVTPSSVEMMNLSFMANGLKGWNWYMIANRDNWCASPINQRGDKQNVFDAYKRVVDVASRIELHELDWTPDLALTTIRRQRCSDSGNWPYAWEALTRTGVDFALVDPALRAPEQSMIVYGGSQTIERDEADNLVAAVEGGATVVVFNTAPRFTRGGESIDPFGVPDADGIRPLMSPFTVAWQGGEFAMPRGGHQGKIWMQYFGALPDNATPIVAQPSGSAAEILVDVKMASVEKNRVPMGYVRPMGKGKVVVLGMSPCEAGVSLALEVAGMRPKVRPQMGRVAATVWTGEKRKAMFVINRNPMALPCPIAVCTECLGRTFTDVESGRSFKADAEGVVTVPVPGYNVRVFEVG